MIPEIDIPEIFEGLFEPHRYKVYWGGRGGAKSETIGRYLLGAGATEPMTILCTREYQTSIKDSVHQLLSYLIDQHGLQSLYEVLNTEIRGRGRAKGTKFIFAGLRHNIDNIKSIPNIKKCWVEEAESVSNHSWNILIPTIRGEGSEIIVSFNPILATSPTYKRFVIRPPSDSIIQKVTYKDNEFFPEVLEKERLECLERDPTGYKNIWEGDCRAAVEGAIFAEVLQKAEEENRITTAPYESRVPVNTYWDLGKQAMTAIWFIQYVGMQYRVLKHYKAHLRDLPHFFKYVKDMPYVYGTHYLPHDAEHNRIGLPENILMQARKSLGGRVEIVPRVSKKIHAINAALQVFGQCVFDEKECEDGINDLRLYAYNVNEENETISKNPMETGYERDTADAFMTFAQTIKPVRTETARNIRSVRAGWTSDIGL